MVIGKQVFFSSKFNISSVAFPLNTRLFLAVPCACFCAEPTACSWAVAAASPFCPAQLQREYLGFLLPTGGFAGGCFPLPQRSKTRSLCGVGQTPFFFSEPAFSFLLNFEISWHGTCEAVPFLPPPASTPPLDPSEPFKDSF